MLTVLVPAHNEEDQIANTISSLLHQTHKPDRIVVVSDNSTDNTVKIARMFSILNDSIEVFETENNSDMKAGALNQRLRTLLPQSRDDDFILVQDADSQLEKKFIENALTKLSNPKYGAIGGTFSGGPGGGLIGHLQRNEYARYARDVRRLKGKCLVVTGTAAVFRVKTLREISSSRIAGILPSGDGHGGVYDTSVLTEDNELTFAIRHLGYEVLSPAGCVLETEVMLTWGDLWNQRLRWKRGAIENCFQYGLTVITWSYWGRQLLTLVGIVVTVIYLATLLYGVLTQSISIQPFWLSITGIFVIERVVTLRDRGWRFMIPAASMYELGYDLFLQVVHARAYWDAIFKKQKSW